MSFALESTLRSSFYAMMGASSALSVGTRGAKQSSASRRPQQPGTFLNEHTPQPTKGPRPQNRRTGHDENTGVCSFGSIVGCPEKPVETFGWLDVDTNIHGKTGSFVYRLGDRHRHGTRSSKAGAIASHSGAADGIWLALFPTAQCKCCALSALHLYPQKCAYVTYKHFEPAKISCWSSVYGSDGSFIYWSRIVKDIRCYVTLALTSGADIRQIHLALKVWNEALNRAERELRRVTGAAIGSANASIPVVARKCGMVSVPAPTLEGEAACQKKRKRIIWVRCGKSSCDFRHTSVMRKSNGNATVGTRVLRTTFDPRVKAGESKQCQPSGQPVHSSRPWTPLSTIIELEED